MLLDKVEKQVPIEVVFLGRNEKLERKYPPYCLLFSQK